MTEEKSKTDAKREAKALQTLGGQIAELAASKRARIPIPENLQEAIDHYNKIKSHSAKKRQLQFIGSIMRGIEDISPIQKAYNEITQGVELNSAHFKRIENWRARLISDDKNALTEFIQQYPNEQTQKLRQLIRQAKLEIANEKNHGASKALFRLIKDIIQ